MRPEKQTTQAIMERLDDYREVIPLIVDKIGLSEKLKSIDNIEYLQNFKTIEGDKSEIDAKIVSYSGELLVWLVFKLDKEFDEAQLQKEYETLVYEAKKKKLGYFLIGISNHTKKPRIFTNQKLNGLNYEWISFEKIRRAFVKFQKKQDERTKLNIERFLNKFFEKPFKMFIKKDFYFISYSIYNFDDTEEFADKCISVERQINAFVKALRKSIGKRYKINSKTIPEIFGGKKLLKLSLPGRIVISILEDNNNKNKIIRIIFNFISKEYTIKDGKGGILTFDIFGKNLIYTIKQFIFQQT